MWLGSLKDDPLSMQTKKKRKLTGQMAFFLEIQMENIGSFFLHNLHDELKHRKKLIVILLNY